MQTVEELIYQNSSRAVGLKTRNTIKGAVIKATIVNTVLGPMIACADENGLCLLEFTDSEKLEQRISSLLKTTARPIVNGRNDVLVRLRSELSQYFAGRLLSFDLPLSVRGSEFQRQVWGGLVKIEYGITTTYKVLAALVGRPTAVRAVAAANGANPVSIVVPCHRVLGSGGALTGYGGGLERKAWLLGHEQKFRV